MELDFAYYGNPILRQKGKKIDVISDEIRMLVEAMVKIMHEHRGIGLAAPQVSLSLALFITEVPLLQEDGSWIEGTLKVYINPEICEVGDEVDIHSEGCLSLPGIHADVVRPTKVRVKAKDINGEEFEEILSGLEARCLLHENDHINGKLFIDRVRGDARTRLEKKLREIKKKFN